MFGVEQILRPVAAQQTMLPREAAQAIYELERGAFGLAWPMVVYAAGLFFAGFAFLVCFAQLAGG
jgi:hypothetical protein